MIIINHPKNSAHASRWKERLEGMTVPHLIFESSDASSRLKENTNAISGAEAIDNFLDQYEKDLKGWNQDRCDMWFFDED
ncbi:hypothetical protein [Roseivirga sp. E12]|uniref:hypothetical protein n=1 Tax=Roseivirga sp. E12 TaxID=2819237 RepID=UPI001ABC3C6D|nr:hypothetical protein [Roseivirga sp. E12]MBO3700620.1 hypothetical protein [Roseivirga sp. E12]